MIELKSGGKTLQLKILEPTLARYAEFKDILNELQKYVDTYGQFKRNIAIAELVKQNPNLLGDLVNGQGGFNEETFKGKVAEYKKQKLSDEEAESKAASDIVERLHLAASHNKEIFVTLVQPELLYPANLQSIIYGIEVIKKTCDVSGLTKNEKSLLNNEDFWNNVEWNGVCRYINSFRQSYS